ncbi:hypothetical protein GW17_00044063 [Ensete ventricosum]|nr:hypothetical protein GW17_00044063 [Ensete ventricosum]
MDVVAKLKRGVSRQLSLGSLSKSRFSLRRQASLDPRLGSASRFAFGRQSSLDPNRRSPVAGELGLPENLDATMRLLFMACQGDARGVEDLLKDGLDVNSIDLDGRTALHIAACEGHVDVVSLLLSWRANIDARDRWGSTASADAQYYGNDEVYCLLKARGAKTPVGYIATVKENRKFLPLFEEKKCIFVAKFCTSLNFVVYSQKTRKTPMTVYNPGEVPEYELNPSEIHFRRGDERAKACSLHFIEICFRYYCSQVVLKHMPLFLKGEDFRILERNSFKNELTLMQKARHPNVVQFVGAVTQNLPMMIISEHLPKVRFIGKVCYEFWHK